MKSNQFGPVSKTPKLYFGNAIFGVVEVKVELVQNHFGPPEGPGIRFIDFMIGYLILNQRDNDIFIFLTSADHKYRKNVLIYTKFSMY